MDVTFPSFFLFPHKFFTEDCADIVKKREMNPGAHLMK